MPLEDGGLLVCKHLNIKVVEFYLCCIKNKKIIAFMRIFTRASVFHVFFVSPMVQFQLLHSKFALCSAPTRMLLMTTYIKFINLFAEMKPHIQEVSIQIERGNSF